MKTLLLFFSLFIVTLANAQTSDELLNKATEIAGKGDFKKALSIINSGLAKDARNWKLNEAAGVFWVMQGRPDSALVYMDRAILFNPSLYDLYMGRAKIYYIGKANDKARADFEMALTLDPPDSVRFEAISTIALIKYEANDYDGALQDMGWVIDHSSGEMRYRSYFGRGMMKSQHNDLQGAYADYKSGYALDSSVVYMLDEFSALCVKLEKWDEAIRLCRRLIVLEPAHVNGYPRLGYSLQKAGRYKESNEALDMAIAQHPKEPYPYSNRSYNKMKLGDLEGAMKDVNQSIRLDRTNSYAYRNRGLIYLAMGEKVQACGEFRMALDLGFTKNYGNEVEELYKTTCR